MNDATPASPKPASDLLLLNRQLCFALYSAMHGVNKIYRSLLKDLDITYPQYLVMLVLWENDGLKVSDICERLYLETTTLTPLLKRLEARGLVRRQRSAKDERQVLISLTDEGRAMRAHAERIPLCVGDAMGCSGEEIEDLRRKLVAIRGKLLRED